MHVVKPVCEYLAIIEEKDNEIMQLKRELSLAKDVIELYTKNVRDIPDKTEEVALKNKPFFKKEHLVPDTTRNSDLESITSTFVASETQKHASLVENYLKDWLDKTGLDPSECEVVIEHAFPRNRVYVRKRNGMVTEENELFASDLVLDFCVNVEDYQ